MNINLFKRIRKSNEPDNSEYGLIFIPDISGYTEIMNGLPLKISSEIVSALLRNIINSNRLNLSISEIEGDAVLFYRFGEPPTIDEIVEQCDHFWQEFHNEIRAVHDAYDFKPAEKKLLNNVGLKFILHYGKFVSTQFKEHSQLMGPDIVIAHKLMKNQIQCREYILLTENLLKSIKADNGLLGFETGSLRHSLVRRTRFRYLPLDLT